MFGISALAVTTSPAADAADATLGVDERFAGLLAAQGHGHPVAVQGRAHDADGGIVIAELLPSQARRAAMKVGDSYPQVLVGAAEVDADGRYALELDPSSRLLATPSEVLLTAIDRRGAVTGVGATVIGNSGQDTTSAPVDDHLDGPRDTVTLDIAASTGTGTDTSTEASTHDDEGSSGGSVLVEDFSCIWSVTQTGITAATTVVVAGTNTSSARVGATFAINASSSLGFAASFGSGWVEGSGGITVTNTSAVSKTWPGSNRYGTFSYRAQSEYHQERSTCLNPDLEYDRQIPVRYTGGFYDPVKWSSTQYPTYCVPASVGLVSVTRSTATKWNGGVKLPVLSVDARSGYSTTVKVDFDFTSSGKYLCGRNDVPAGTPGYLMADYRDR